MMARSAQPWGVANVGKFIGSHAYPVGGREVRSWFVPITTMWENSAVRPPPWGAAIRLT